MHKFFVEKQCINDNIALIEGDDVKHINKVLRLKIGEIININNFQGEEFLARLTEIDKKVAKAEILESLEINNESYIDIVLFQGVPKSSKMDLIVQKATELGVKEIVPMITDRVVVNVSEYKKLERLNKIAQEACKQSKRSIVPKVKEPTEFSEILKTIEDFDLVVVPYENAENYGIKAMMKNIKKENIKSIAILIGPEGGFEDSEITALKEKNAEIVTLGPRILRTESAGFTCISILMYEIGDLGGNL
ncbi:MAG: 16S rRNA (uracil(1498)-N(3))-methyltransferase [Clostridiaceae bacterium]